MTKVEQTWSADAFDAISIKVQRGKFVIQGTDGDQVKLEGDIAARYSKNLELGPAERWLKIYTSWTYGETQFTLQLPRSKIWTIDLFSGKAQFKAENIQARMHLWLGSGEVQIENCRGAFSITSGNADVKVKRFIEVITPEVTSLPREERHIRMDDPESWGEWGEEWSQWGGEIGEKFLRGFFGQTAGQTPMNRVQTGKGDLILEDFDVQTCTVRTGKGDAKLKQGRAGNLDIKLMNGDIECESCLPTGDWTIRSNRGDIRLALPSDTIARLDLTTRHGDIQSKTPLVSVTRQGPESWHGNRMVGSIGAKIEGKIPQIRLSTLSGDIEIKTQPTSSRYYDKPVNENIPVSPPPPQPVVASVSPLASKPAVIYSTPLAVLTALSEGKISIDEAERLLRGLKT
jgi:hypothetical protein